MKLRAKYFTVLMVLAAIFSSGCQDEVFETFNGNSPVYMSYEDLRQSVNYTSTQNINKPGKIYFKDDFIFINELMKGVHVVDVSNPSDPQQKGFIEIPGNVDIAIKEDVLYADSYVDLVAIDVSNLDAIKEVGRVEDIFPYTLPEYNTDYRITQVDKEKGVVIDWEIKKVKQKLEHHYYPVYKGGDEMFFDLSSVNSGGVGGGGGSTFGVGGSMARFGLYKNFLYTIDESNLYTFDIQDLDSPAELGNKSVGWGIETMFIYNHHMFLGTTSGMLIYSLEIEQDPKFINNYRHITSCDPVVVQDDLAYVTLHDGGGCGRSVNRLDIIKMNDDYSELSQLASHSMANPHGLGIDGDILFICDGAAGLKIFNASNPEEIPANKIAEFPDINTYDVIPMNNYLFMVGEGGFYLYDYSNLQNIHLLATIPVSTGS